VANAVADAAGLWAAAQRVDYRLQAERKGIQPKDGAVFIRRRAGDDGTLELGTMNGEIYFQLVEVRVTLNPGSWQDLRAALRHFGRAVSEIRAHARLKEAGGG
jgi:hypothetical protein